MSTLLVVVGATGGQGSSVIGEILKTGKYDKIRGVTRSVTSPKSQALAAQGVEMMAANLDDQASLEEAFRGATAIFAATDYYEPFRLSGGNMWTTMETEYRHGTNLARAASATATLRHYVWSTLPSAHHASRGKHFVGHFEAKARVDDYIRSQLPELLTKTTFLWLGFFMSNFAKPTFAPVYSNVLKKYMLLLPTPPTTPFGMLADHSANVGKFVDAILDGPPLQKYVLGVVETVSIADYARRWGRAVGKTIEFVQITPEAYADLFPTYSAEMQTMFQFWAEYGERAWPADQLVTPADLGIDHKLVSLDEAWKTAEWDWIA